VPTSAESWSAQDEALTPGSAEANPPAVVVAWQLLLASQPNPPGRSP
jgi:hypothetical protein